MPSNNSHEQAFEDTLKPDDNWVFFIQRNTQKRSRHWKNQAKASWSGQKKKRDKTKAVDQQPSTN